MPAHLLVVDMVEVVPPGDFAAGVWGQTRVQKEC